MESSFSSYPIHTSESHSCLSPWCCLSLWSWVPSIASGLLADSWPCLTQTKDFWIQQGKKTASSTPLFRFVKCILSRFISQWILCNVHSQNLQVLEACPGDSCLGWGTPCSVDQYVVINIIFGKPHTLSGLNCRFIILQVTLLASATAPLFAHEQSSLQISSRCRGLTISHLCLH